MIELPDLDQCQAEKPGNGPFTMGGEIGDPRNGYRIRCKNKPLWIAVEKETGSDGQRGWMSLCAECAEVMEKQMPGYAILARISHTPGEAAAIIEQRLGGRR